jgi:hypothetical protein
MWRGHLAVTCGPYVLDPTIDQAAAGKIRLRPAVFLKPAGWDESGRDDGSRANGTAYWWDERGLMVRYGKYHRQVGWKSAGDARPSHWRDIVAEMERLSTRPRRLA